MSTVYDIDRLITENTRLSSELAQAKAGWDEEARYLVEMLGLEEG
jgi:hypothetical protein